MLNMVLALAALQDEGGDGSEGLGILAGILGIGFFMFMMVFALIMIVSAWKVFVKAGKPGWAAIVPIYNMIVMLEVVGKPLWWIVLFFLPIANFVAGILVCIALAEKFGKGAGFGIGLAFLGFVFFPILAFSDAEYKR